MTPLKERFQKHLTLKRLSPKTHQAYIGAVTGLALYYHKSPDQLSDAQVQESLISSLSGRFKSVKR
ncbi:MAG: phage integrase N-terminal SAM-like domain-containing protein [Desulfamplus sp.]|nr:phage integrase N-terminal SAM-like domain-containing protein [Desulfamplus sp.]